MLKHYFLSLLLLLLFACSPPEQSPNSTTDNTTVLGELQHGFKLNQLTQEKFDEGLLLLHNFEYVDALVAFQEATNLDTTEVMTHWGEAMCHYRALWKLHNLEEGNEILARFGATKEERFASIEDPMENRLWGLVEIMYGEGEIKEKNQDIKEYMASLHQQYPQHQEIAAFYALSLIWATDEYGDGSDDLRLAAAITDKITQVNPLHPGALHYKIHALDGPTSAQDAVDAADKYAKVASDAAHALHMPSHIYLALGKWDGVVTSNQKSYDASVDRMVRLDKSDSSRGYHSLSWLHYGLLQQGKYTQAEQILNDMLTYVPRDPTKKARSYLLGMQSRQLSEGGKVAPETQLDTDVEVDDIGIILQSTRSFVRAQVAMQSEDVNQLNNEIKYLSNKIIAASQEIEEGGGSSMCASGSTRYAPTENTVRGANVILSQIKGMKALLEGNEDQFEKHLKNAVKLEDQKHFPSGPPSSKPSFEQYGDWLLAKGEYAEALMQYERALVRMPKRLKSLKGKMLAHQALNQANEVAQVQKELKSLLANADGEVKSFLDE